MEVSYLTDKGSGLVNEDSYVVNKNLFGVFDGATGIIKYNDAKGNTGGLLASQIAKEIFEQNPNAPLVSSLEIITDKIKSKMEEAKIPLKEKGGLWTTSASVVRVLDTSIEYIQIGDSPIIFIKKNGEIQTFFVDHDLEILKLWELLAKEDTKDIRHDKRMEDQLLNLRRQTNITYGVLNGEKEALKFVLQGNISIDDLSHIIVFTDGMLIPQENPGNPENFETIVKLYEEGGLAKVKDYIRQIEDSDPNCKRYPRFKQYDDLTAIAIDFENFRDGPKIS